MKQTNPTDTWSQAMRRKQYRKQRAQQAIPAMPFIHLKRKTK